MLHSFLHKKLLNKTKIMKASNTKQKVKYIKCQNFSKYLSQFLDIKMLLIHRVFIAISNNLLYKYNQHISSKPVTYWPYLRPAMKMQKVWGEYPEFTFKLASSVIHMHIFIYIHVPCNYYSLYVEMKTFWSYRQRLIYVLRATSHIFSYFETL